MRSPGAIAIGASVLVAACTTSGTAATTRTAATPTTTRGLPVTTLTVAVPASTLPATSTTATPSAWVSLPESPLTPRHGHSAIWTGEELIIWGGTDNPGLLDPFSNDGAAYDPVERSWRKIAEAPIGKRLWHSAVWTGGEMIVWGGFGDHAVVEAAAYQPVTDTWRPIADAPISPRWWGHSTTWTGTEMIIWGNRPGESAEPVGAAYDPAVDTWRVLPASPVGNRTWHSAVWTGEELIIWGGQSFADGARAEYLSDGAAYEPVSDTWRLISAAPIGGRWQHTAVWTGATMIIWGGAASDESLDALADGAIYDPASDSWSTLAPSPIAARNEHAAFWVDGSMIIWGGHERTSGSSWAQFSDGAVYDPATGSWTPLPDAPAAGTLTTTPSIWTGEHLLYWGQGNDFSTSGGAAHATPAP